MRKINNLFVFMMLVVAFASCSEVEPLDPILSGQVNSGGDNGSGSGSSGGNSGGTSSGDYWPTAINNEWTYDSNGSSSTMKIIATETVNGQLYYKFAPQSGNGSMSSGIVNSSVNKTSGVYKLKTDDVVIDAGGITGTQTGYEYIVLKDNIPVNGTWNGSYTQTTTYTGIPPITFTTNYVGTILAKGVSETVNNEVFADVIKVKIDLTTNVPGVPATTIVSEYWYAKDVGIIKATNIGSGVNYENILVDYILY
ncbi:hypothetical protein GOQ30_01790 [Flavobacterium sp. TP390]|uniref:Uncharacterized protein n=1 Tax=Flavobacterium profundi TaxID=1774945 RepID=A0A6I4IEA4_9FLAO|nr:hypothetical protein [Flavobacterium profundi]MVO07895.1 hypothetical protein [Flavobacterium profundi]